MTAGWAPISVCRLTLIGLAIAGYAGGGSAHDGVIHKTPDEAAAHLRDEPNTPGFPNIKGGDFKLIDQHGKVRTSKDPEGHYQLLFFGYANCKAICSVSLPRMAKAVDLLEKDGHLATPVLITVDRERDTVAALEPAVKKIHPRMVGLTGSEQALDVAYKAFQVEKKIVFEDPKLGPVYNHGSFIYLLAPDGSFKTILPPILGPERIAEVVTKYISQAN